jgi:hypothetical protein
MIRGGLGLNWWAYALLWCVWSSFAEAGKHVCGKETLLELEEGKCILELSCAGVLSRPSSEGCSTVMTLELFDKGITALDVGVFKGMDNLQALYLSHNTITHIPAGVFTLPVCLGLVFRVHFSLTT